SSLPESGRQRADTETSRRIVQSISAIGPRSPACASTCASTLGGLGASSEERISQCAGCALPSRLKIIPRGGTPASSASKPKATSGAPPSAPASVGPASPEPPPSGGGCLKAAPASPSGP